MKDQTHLAITVASTVAMAIRSGKASIEDIYPVAERLHLLAERPIDAHQIALVCPMLDSKDCEYVLSIIKDAADSRFQRT